MIASLYTDGGSRGNPGIAGCGGVLKDEKNEILCQYAQNLGIQTNNFAEYMGLIIGLQKALEKNIKTLKVYMDSKLVVEQMSGRWKVKHPQIKILAQKAHEFACQFENITYHHVLRGKNQQADILANQAMDQK